MTRFLDIERIEQILKFFLYFSASIIVFSTVYMVFINAHPFPDWDGWDGHREFLYKIYEPNSLRYYFGELLRQHNEHRIGLTNLLFLVDDYFFSGNSNFLFLINAVLPALLTFCLWSYSGLRKYFYLPIILAFLYLFDQSRNFTWSFQSQFFMAYYIPLIGFLFIADKGRTSLIGYSAIVVVMSILSMFTMANGILVSPAIAAYFILFKPDLRRAGLAFLTFALVILLYFVVLQYETKASPGSAGLDTLLSIPGIVDFAKYVLTYIGFVLDVERANYFGSVFVIGVVTVFGRLLFLRFNGRSDEVPTLAVASAMFIMYFMASVLLTSLGRSAFGIAQASSSRYATPSVVAWLCLFLLYCELFLPRKVAFNAMGNYRQSFIYLVSCALFMVLLLNSQRDAFRKWDWSFVQKKSFAILALTAEVGGKELSNVLYPDDRRVRALLDKHKSHGEPYLIDSVPYALANQIGNTTNFKPFLECHGRVDSADKVIQGHVLSGWHLGASRGSSKALDDQALYVLDSDGRIIGAGFTGFARPDVTRIMKRSQYNSGFRVLIPDSVLDYPTNKIDILIVNANGLGCKMPTSLQLRTAGG